MAGNISEIMAVGEQNAVADRHSLFREVLVELDRKRLGAVGVVEDGKLVGLVTDGDVRRMILKTQHSLAELFVTEIEKFMNKDPKTLKPDTSLEEALNLLEAHRFWVVPVVDENRQFLGMVHLHHLLKAMAG